MHTCGLEVGQERPHLRAERKEESPLAELRRDMDLDAHGLAGSEWVAAEIVVLNFSPSP